MSLTNTPEPGPGSLYDPRAAELRVRELVSVFGTGEALVEAAELAAAAQLPHEDLLHLWTTAVDPDAFCAELLAPALTREGVSKLDLYLGVKSLEGLRHLTMLRELTLFRCKEITDITDLAALTGLVELNLDGCAGIHDLTPLSGLTALTSLNLHRCRAVEDTRPLLTLKNLRHLDLSMTRVRSAAGFGAAFPELRKLSLQGCRSFKDAHHFSGLRKLSELNVGWTGIRNLDGLRDVGDVSTLDLTSCKRLTSLKGIDAMPRLTDLRLEKCSRLTSVDGLGTHPDLDTLYVQECSELRDLRGLAPLAGLRFLQLDNCEQLASLAGLESLTSLVHLNLDSCPEVTDLSPLDGLWNLNRLHMHELYGLRDLTSLGALPGLGTLSVWKCRALRGLHGPGNELPQLKELRVADCPSLAALDHVGELPALEKAEISDCAVLADIGGLAGSPVGDLILYKLPVLTDLGALAELPHLRSLTVYRCPGVRTVPAEGCERIQLSDVRGKDLTGLRAGPDLREIRLDSDELEDISALTRLPGLVDVNIRYCRGLKDWSPLLDIPALERFQPPGHQVYRTESVGGTDPVVEALVARGVTRYG